MEDLTQALQDILGTKEGQEKLKEIMQMLGGGDGNIDMSLFSELLSGASGSNKQQENAQTAANGFDLGGLDMQMLLNLKKMMEGMNGHDKHTDLIRALKPLLRPERQKKADNAIKILKLLSLWPMLKESGMLDEFFPNL